LLAAGTGSFARDGRGHSTSAFAVGPALAALVFIVLPVVLRMRPDVSTRVFLPVLPGALVLVLRSAASLRPGLATWVLRVALGWALLAPGLRFGTEFLSTERVEVATKRELAAAITGPTIVLGTDVVWEIGARELEALAGHALPVQILRVVPPRLARGLFVEQQTGRSLPALRAAGLDVLAFTIGTRGPRASLPPARDLGASWLPRLAGGAVEAEVRFRSAVDSGASLQPEGPWSPQARFAVRIVLPAWSLHGLVQRAAAGLGLWERVQVSSAWWRR
jgi:hypothetical protein